METRLTSYRSGPFALRCNQCESQCTTPCITTRGWCRIRPTATPRRQHPGLGSTWTTVRIYIKHCPTRHKSHGIPSHVSTELDRKQLDYPLYPVPPLCKHENCENCYVGYPQSRFPNWSHRQVVKSRIYHAIHEYSRHKPCNLYRLDVANDGVFSNPGPLVAAYGHDSVVWEQLKHDKVSHMLYHFSAIVDLPIISATNWYPGPCYVHRKSFGARSPDAGSKVSGTTSFTER